MNYPACCAVLYRNAKGVIRGMSFVRRIVNNEI